jgi:SAM-dependent methyltransferase
MNAGNLGFNNDTFDIALCGFMGWDDCFDFDKLSFTRQDRKAPEILRVLREGGRFVCCSWDAQEDVTWMENAVLRYHPTILEDHDYLEQRPIGMSYEKVQGYELIFRKAGFRDIKISSHAMTFVSTNEEEWWMQMRQLGWSSFVDKIEDNKLRKLKDAIFNDLQTYKKIDGIHFRKAVFYICGRK